MAIVYLKDFPEELWRKIKSVAAIEGKSIRQWVIDNLRKLVEKGEK